MEKNSVYVYTYISESLCWIPETDVTLYTNYASIKKKKIKHSLHV